MKLRNLFVLILAVILCNSIVQATDVTFQLFDGNGKIIPQSKFIVIHLVKDPITGDSIEKDPIAVDPMDEVKLVPGNYKVKIYPGLNSIPQEEEYLYAIVSEEISGSEVELEYQWKTAELRVVLHDQDDVLIEESYWQGFGMGSITEYIRAIDNSGNVDDKDFVILPVTENNSSLNHIAGSYSDGYWVNLYPGLNGNGQKDDSKLYREVFELDLPVEGKTHKFIWPTAQLAIKLNNQSGELISGSQWRGSGMDFFPGDKLADGSDGSSVTLPVTTYDNFETKGYYKNGYCIKLIPGINGKFQDDAYCLSRKECDLDLMIDGLTAILEWPELSCPVQIVNNQMNPIEGSHFVLPGKLEEVPNGDNIRLPVTNNPEYSDLNGSCAEGYKIEMFLNGSSVGHQIFEVTMGMQFTPTLQDFGGEQYGLRCPCNLDTDEDGICDIEDNCPGDANPDQKDDDGNGLGDECDWCGTDDAPNIVISGVGESNWLDAFGNPVKKPTRIIDITNSIDGKPIAMTGWQLCSVVEEEICFYTYKFGTAIDIPLDYHDSNIPIEAVNVDTVEFIDSLYISANKKYVSILWQQICFDKEKDRQCWDLTKLGILYPNTTANFHCPINLFGTDRIEFEGKSSHSTKWKLFLIDPCGDIIDEYTNEASDNKSTREDIKPKRY